MTSESRSGSFIGFCVQGERVRRFGQNDHLLQQVIDLVVGHAHDVNPRDAHALGRLPHELNAPLGDAPRRPHLPPRHALCQQFQDQLGPYPLRHLHHFLSLSEWRMGQV